MSSRKQQNNNNAADKAVKLSKLLASKYCGKCVHIINIPGNCHIGCANLNAKPTRKMWKGCGIWPLNFDTATVESCDGYSENQNDEIDRKETPLLELMRLLAG